MGASVPCNKIDIARMLRLVNCVHETKDSAQARRHALLDGLCRLTAASVALLLIGSIVGAGEREAQWFTIDGGACNPALMDSLDAEDEECDPAFQKMLRRARQRRHGQVATFTRRELTDDQTWYSSQHVREVRRKAGLDDSLYSSLTTGADKVACICLSRRWGSQRRFGNREKNILDLLHPACAWVYHDESPKAYLDSLALSPREKQTLWKLLAGRGEKEIAAEMHLSINTVHHYVKALYKHFDVSSRAELLAKWMGRQG
jgi:DNA-binding CsgD family transcriptional regulator